MPRNIQDNPYPLSVSQLAETTSETTARINRFREKGIIPPQLHSKEQAGTRIRYAYKEEAVQWVEFAQKFSVWRTTELELGEFFEECLHKCGGATTKTLEALERAFNGATNFEQVKNNFSCK